MTSPFVVREHVFEGQHIREYPKALAGSDEDVVRLHANSYTPLEVASGSTTGDLTVIAFHANAFHKEVYEPFFEALYQCLKQHKGLTVGSIWIADQAAQGSSALLNDEILGNDPSWFDHSRDTLAIVNTFRKHMKQPIVGIGHSMGGMQVLTTAHLHPRLCAAVIMIDPSVSRVYAPTMKGMLRAALIRPTSYDSRAQAEQALRDSPMTKGWDPKVVQRFVDTSFHSSPTLAVPDHRVKPKTTRYAEAATLARFNTNHLGVSEPLSDVDRILYPNVDPTAPLTAPVYNAHARMAWNWLPSLRPPALFINGEGSRVCFASEIEQRTHVTGTAPGGSGGVAAGMVASVTIPGGHFLPMINVRGTAEVAAAWLQAEVARHNRLSEQVSEIWRGRSMADRQKLEPGVEQVLNQWDGKPWPKPAGSREKSRL